MLALIAALASASVHLATLLGIDDILIRGLGRALLWSFLVTVLYFVFSSSTVPRAGPFLHSHALAVALGALLMIALAWSVLYAVVATAGATGSLGSWVNHHGGSERIGLLCSSSVCTWAFATTGAILWAKRG